MGKKQAHHGRLMRVVLALVIAALAAIELVLLCALFISLFVAPGGSGEFFGIDRFSYEIFVFVFFPLPAFVIFLLLVLKFCTPANRKDFRNLAVALAVALAAVPVVMVFDTDRNPYRTPLHLVINGIMVFAAIVVILWRRLTREEDTLQTSA